MPSWVELVWFTSSSFLYILIIYFSTFLQLDVEEQPHISVPDFRSFSISEDLHSETASHTRSETASSGYASMHGIEPSAPSEDNQNGLKNSHTLISSHINLLHTKVSVLHVTALLTGLWKQSLTIMFG